MQLIDGGMFAFAAYHALKKKVKYPLTFQVPRMLRKLVDEVQDTYIVFWNGENLWRRKRVRGYRDRPEICAEARKQLGDRTDQLAMNLQLVDLSRAAVGPPPPPLDDYWDKIEAAQTVGKHLDIEYLTADTLAEDYASFAEWGRATMQRVEGKAKHEARRTKSEERGAK